MEQVIDKLESEKTIFIQMASYRDPELRPTLKDLFDKADNPEVLRVCVAWQHHPDDEWDNLNEWVNDPRVLILNIDSKASKGACWARNLIQQHYKGEDYTLQLDSHHRFVLGWDTELKEMFNQLKNKGVKKPLITSYIPSYDPKNDPKGRVLEPWQMNFDRFAPEGYIFTRPSTLRNWETLTEPVPARFYSAHFAFTIGDFAREVQHDPLMYFHGEEPSISVRAFTFGYDLYHPHKIVCWHEYTRNGKTKHWDDDKEWAEKNDISHYRYRVLHGMNGVPCTPCSQKELRPYVFGTERTLEDYEKFAGVKFATRGVQRYTLNEFLPPNPWVEDYENSFETIFKHCIDLHKNDIEDLDYDFWVISFEEEDGTVIYREDADEKEIKQILRSNTEDSEWYQIWRTYQGPKPFKCVVWQHSKSGGWGNRIEKTI